MSAIWNKSWNLKRVDPLIISHLKFGTDQTSVKRFEIEKLKTERKGVLDLRPIIFNKKSDMIRHDDKNEPKRFFFGKLLTKSSPNRPSKRHRLSSKLFGGLILSVKKSRAKVNGLPIFATRQLALRVDLNYQEQSRQDPANKAPDVFAQTENEAASSSKRPVVCGAAPALQEQGSE